MNLLILFIVTIFSKYNGVLGQLIQDCETPSVLNDTLRIDVQFRIADIVPGVIPSAPQDIASLTWGTAAADLGNCISPLETILAPIFDYENIDPDTNYTIIVCDLDCPSRTASVLSLCLISMNVNVLGKLVPDDQEAGFAVARYDSPAPAPATGPHRNLLLVYEQEKYIDIYDLDLLYLGVDRVRFNLDEFVKKYSLGKLAAGNFWLTSISENYCNLNNCCNTNNNNYYNQISSSKYVI